MKISRFFAAMVLAFVVVVPSGVTAQVLPEGPVLAAADLRERQDLSGEWTYSIDPYRDGMAGFHGGEAGTGHRRYDDTDVEAARRADPLALYEYDLDRSPVALLPSSWLTHAPEMRHYHGLVWYQRRFDIEPGSASATGRRQFIRFGAVNYAAEVWLNGQRLGRHEGGFTPFAFEVTGKLRPSGNRLVVGVDSQRDDRDVPPPVTDWETYGGITRPVHLIDVPQTYVDDAWVRLADRATIAVDLQLSGDDAAGRPATVAVPQIGLTRRVKTDDRGRAQITIPLPGKARLWSPDDPQLYDVTITAGEDIWRDRVGLRTIETRGAQMLLNGEPIFLRGISMHEEELGDNPTRNMTPDAARALLSIVKDDLNGNFVRLAHYPHGDVTVRAADELGLLVWSEIPVYWRIAFTDAGVLADARAMLGEMIRRDRNRASVIIWSVGNETPVDAPRNAFMVALATEAKRLDPSRLVSAALLIDRDNAGGTATMRLADPLADHLDVLAVNTYNGWYGPDRPDQVPGMMWDVPADKPLLFSEFGAGAEVGVDPGTGELPIKFSEEYQALYYRATLAMAEQIPTLAGMSPWILKDFRSPRRQLPGIQDGWNRKGLIRPDGQKKQAFDVVARWYAARE